MDTELIYAIGIGLADPRVKADLRIGIRAKNGLNKEDYNHLVQSFSDIITIIEKYNKETE